LRNQRAVKANDEKRRKGKRVSTDNTLKEYRLTTSVAGIIPLIIKSIEERRNPQVLCSSKLMLHAILGIVKKHFTDEVCCVLRTAQCFAHQRQPAGRGGGG
jgi:hypothetical protein